MLEPAAPAAPEPPDPAGPDPPAPVEPVPPPVETPPELPGSKLGPPPRESGLGGSGCGLSKHEAPTARATRRHTPVKMRRCERRIEGGA
jgi:hypothetical protein